MELYQHDGSRAFRFHPRGRLEGQWVIEFEHAWQTAVSMPGREMIVELSGLTDVDQAGMALLRRLHEAGASFTLTAQAKSHEWARQLGLPVRRVAAPRADGCGFRQCARRLLRLGRAAD